jgi:hypothetical protein
MRQKFFIVGDDNFIPGLMDILLPGNPGMNRGIS